MKDDLKSRYSYHIPTAQARQKIKTIRRHIRVVAEAIDMLCPEGRSKHAAFAHLDNVMTSANAAIALECPIDPEDQ